MFRNMKRARKVLFMASLASSLMLGACSVFGVRSGTEEPHFEVVERIGSVEVRQYAPRLAVETTVEGEPAAARREGFGRLAAYIFGGNAGRASIAMTAPVAQSGTTIAMTAPVGQAPVGQGSADAGSVIRFYLPSGLVDPPQPNDARVRVVPIPAETVAVLRYTGSTAADMVAAEGGALLAALQGTRWQPVGAPGAWFYDPPWTLPPLRRNEAVVAVVPLGPPAGASAGSRPP